MPIPVLTALAILIMLGVIAKVLLTSNERMPPKNITRFILLLLGIWAIGNTLSCGWLTDTNTAPLSGPPAKTFIITADAYPADWEAVPCESQLCNNGDATYEQTFVPKAYESVKFMQEVFRFTTVEAASSKYRIYRNANFEPSRFDPIGTDFAPPAELPYTSPIADEYYFACGHDLGLTCNMVARYRNYFVYLYFFRSNGQGHALKYSEIEKILQWLDDAVCQALCKSTG